MTLPFRFEVVLKELRLDFSEDLPCVNGPGVHFLSLLDGAIDAFLRRSPWISADEE